MDHLNLLKQLSINALFWVGLVAIVLSLLAGSLYFLIFFVGLVIFNYIIVNLIARAQPSALSEIPSLATSSQPTQVQTTQVPDQGTLGFRLTPVAYPKVMDSELRDYAPEYINVNIEQNGTAIFSGNFARNALKQFRDGINQVLNVKNVQNQNTQTPKEQQPILKPQVPEKPKEQTPTAADPKNNPGNPPIVVKLPPKPKTAKKRIGKKAKKI